MNLSHAAFDAKLAPFVKPCDGCVDIFMLKNVARIDGLVLATKFADGSHIYYPTVDMYKVRRMIIEPHSAKCLDSQCRCWLSACPCVGDAGDLEGKNKHLFRPEEQEGLVDVSGELVRFHKSIELQVQQGACSFIY